MGKSLVVNRQGDVVYFWEEGSGPSSAQERSAQKDRRRNRIAPEYFHATPGSLASGAKSEDRWSWVLRTRIPTGRLDIEFEPGERDEIRQQIFEAAPASLGGRGLERVDRRDGVRWVLDGGYRAMVRFSGTGPYCESTPKGSRRTRSTSCSAIRATSPESERGPSCGRSGRCATVASAGSGWARPADRRPRGCSAW